MNFFWLVYYKLVAINVKRIWTKVYLINLIACFSCELKIALKFMDLKLLNAAKWKFCMKLLITVFWLPFFKKEKRSNYFRLDLAFICRALGQTVTYPEFFLAGWYIHWTHNGATMAERKIFQTLCLQML